MFCCISFGVVDKKLLIPLLGGLINLTFRNLTRQSIISEHLIMLNMCFSLGMSLSFIPYLIMIKGEKSVKAEIPLSSKPKTGK